ncbi:MAG: type II secretion system F family protein [Planctomycetaceae bacterium]|jgi:type II secretory pathway component PulF|nr:type II secretion system F family protein [Planctomycetaceae bacterium]
MREENPLGGRVPSSLLLAPMNMTPMNMTPILQEVRIIRRRENFFNVLKFIGVVFFVSVLIAVVLTLTDPEKSVEMIPFMAVFCFFFFIVCIYNMVGALLPFMLYWWGNVQTIWQRTLLSLIQTSVATDTPIQNVVRAYAAQCFSWYASSLLERFAIALDAGKSLEEALRENRGLLRYDVAGIIRLGGGNDPDTLRSLETIASDERDFSTVKTDTLIRIVYLCIVCMYMSVVVTFMSLKIVPAFDKIFQDFECDLPPLTTFVIGVSNFCWGYWYLGAIFGSGVVFALIIYLILQTSCIVFRPWGFRRMFCSTDSAKFLLVLAAGIHRQFSIPIILRMYTWTVPSAYLRRKGMRIRTAVESGGDWIDAVCRSGFVNAPEASLLRSAQRTGNTAAVLDQLAHSKERAQMRKDDLLSKLTFVTMVFLLAAVVGTFVISMFLPLIWLIEALV